MANETTTSNLLNDIAGKEQFFGTVPKELEVSVTATCLGAPIQYRKDQITGLTLACMLVPTEGSGMQPAIVTYGKEDSMGRGAYQALYHQLGCEELMNPKSNKDACDYLISNFDKRFNLGNGNSYASTVLGPKFDLISKYAKESYPEYHSQFTDFKSTYMDMLGKYYSSGKTQASDKELEKKTNNVALSETVAQTVSQINA